ncbi:hypothetical protein ANAEL_04003 [Anaerolineales bacterium]|nr:hypothetical protein ANAEL_04003 [Anaerolineales bacterium]
MDNKRKSEARKMLENGNETPVSNTHCVGRFEFAENHIPLGFFHLEVPTVISMTSVPLRAAQSFVSNGCSPKPIKMPLHSVIKITESFSNSCCVSPLPIMRNGSGKTSSKFTIEYHLSPFHDDWIFFDKGLISIPAQRIISRTKTSDSSLTIAMLPCHG